MAFAPTRSGKGVGLVVPTLLSWTGSAVVHDIKGENWQLTAGWRARFSHCLLFNPTDLASARYNPLLEVRRGEFMAFLGPSGCGKTTLLNLIAGFLPPDAGEIFIRGRPMARTEPFRRDVGMVFQNYALFPHMRVAENVAFVPVPTVPVTDRLPLVAWNEAAALAVTAAVVATFWAT